MSQIRNLFSPPALDPRAEAADLFIDSIPADESRRRLGSGGVWATWRAIDLIAKAVISVPSAIVRKGTKATHSIPALERLLQHANPDETWRDFLYRTLFHYHLTGAAFWLKSEATLAGDRPRDLYTLNPRNVRIAVRPQGGIHGFLYRVSGEMIALDRCEVIMFRRPHPMDDYRGLGELEAGQSLLDDLALHQSISAGFLENGMRPAGILFNAQPGNVTEAEWEQAKRRWDHNYGRPQNTGRMAFLSGDWKYQRLGIAPSEFQGFERTAVDNVFALHGVPLSVAGRRIAASRDVAKVDLRRFREYTVLPDVLMLQDRINSDLVAGFDPSAELAFQVAGTLLGSEEDVQGYAALRGMGAATANDLRRMLALPTMETATADRTLFHSDLVPLAAWAKTVELVKRARGEGDDAL